MRTRYALLAATLTAASIGIAAAPNAVGQATAVQAAAVRATAVRDASVQAAAVQTAGSQHAAVQDAAVQDAAVQTAAQDARAQDAGTYDPGQLPAINGKVAEYSLTPRGDVDGLILTDGTEVHLPPHLGTQLVYAVKPGDAVTIHGLRAREIPMVQAMSISNDASGATVTDSGAGGLPGPRGPQQPLTADGRIKSQLHGPAGDLNGVLLEDGTIVRLPPPEAQRLAAELTPGAPLYVQGNGIAGPLGRVIAAQRIGPNPNQLAQIAAPLPAGPPHGPPHDPPPGPGRFAPPPPPAGPGVNPPPPPGPGPG